MAKLSPMMQQYFDIKEKYQDTILFFRLGDFYEMFYDDAEKCSKELELTLTGKDCGQEERAPMCGVPYHAADQYIDRLIEKGYKVAICEQVEDPAKAKGIVKRDVIKVVTAGTVTDSKILDEKSNNYLCTAVLSGNDAAMMIAEHVGGSVDHFVEMMNEEAAAIGATSSHFMNPHGLTNPEHYTSVYDIYLIYNAALKYDIIQDIISRKNSYAEYTRSDGSEGAVTWESTNHYFTNEAEAPDDVVIYGGKTGTTDDAGACLSLLSKDLYGNPYLSIILHANDKDALYQEMNQVLSLIGSTDS